MYMVLMFALAQSPQAPPKIIDDTKPSVRQQSDARYKQKMKEAIEHNRKLIAFVNVPERVIIGAVSVGCWYPDSDESYILVGVPDGKGGMNLERKLSAKATDAQIGGGLIQQPLPFQTTTARPDDLQTRLVSLWPEDVDKPEGLVAYKPARFSQRLVILNGAPDNRWFDKYTDDVTSNSFAENPNKKSPWAVPGGLDNATGWESILAVSMPDKVYTYRDNVPVMSAGRDLPKLRWTFPEGTKFVDLLAKDGKVFELRTRTKIKGQWVSRVEYSDKGARPNGYHGLNKACIECHEHAGASHQYGITIRGDDGAFSWNPYED